MQWHGPPPVPYSYHVQWERIAWPCPEKKAGEGEWLIQGQTAYHWKGCVQKPGQLDCRSASKHMLWPFPSSYNMFLVLREVIKVSETVRRVTPGSAFTPTFQYEVRAGLHRARTCHTDMLKLSVTAVGCDELRCGAALATALLPGGLRWHFQMVLAADLWLQQLRLVLDLGSLQSVPWRV